MTCTCPTCGDSGVIFPEGPGALGLSYEEWDDCPACTPQQDEEDEQ